MDTLFTDTEVVLVAIHATADGQPFLVGLVGDLLARAAHYRTRVGIIGGSGSLLTFDGGPRLLDSSEFRFKNRVEAGAQADVLAALRADEGDADWFYASPAFVYGAHAPGVQTGTYRIGSDVLLRNPSGISEISGPDFASAVLDEVQSPRHHRRRFTAAH
jgi:putative NADH-flavin reductase